MQWKDGAMKRPVPTEGNHNGGCDERESCDERERGVILILSMLVVLVLACVIVQLFFTTSVNREITKHQKIHYPMVMAARGAVFQTTAVLIQDLENQSMDEGASEEEGGGLEPGSGGEPGAGEEGGEEGGMEDNTAATDSFVDEWARPGAIAVTTSNELDVMVLVRDEDAKFNILSVVAKDEEDADLSRERLSRLIDSFRENTRFDVSLATSERIVDSIVRWIEGDRDTDRFPKPLTKTGAKDEDPKQSDEDLIHYPLTIDELRMCEGVTAEILYGFMDDGERIPGLIEYVTCYSNLIFDSIPKDEEDENWDPGFGDGEEEGEDPPGEEGEEGEEEEEETAEPVETNNGRININTAPFAVLRGLISEDEIPNSVLEKIIEFRGKALEAYEEMERRDGEFGAILEEEDNEDFIFTDAAEVFDRVEEYFDTDFNLEKDVETEFTSLLETKSNVFTIYVSVRKPESKVQKNFRAVVWRWSGTTSAGEETEEEDTETFDEAQIIPIVVLEDYPYPLPLTEEEEEEILETF
jgi:type II secretory pathway component PulK